MRKLDVDGGQTLQLGFGCGSVMGRVGRRDSLAAMHAAWDAGVTLFDTARSYGYGEAEGLLGEFLQGRRAQATIITKFGIVPRLQPLWRRAARPMVRGLLQLLPAARASVRRSLAKDLPPPSFDVGILQRSLEESLRALRTDYVDVLLAHEAPASVMAQEDLMAALEGRVQAGKALRVGISGTQAVAAQVAAQPSALSVLQFPANLYMPVEPTLAVTTTHLKIANHTFGGPLRAREAQAKLAAMAVDPAVDGELREKLRGDADVRMAEVVFAAVQYETGARCVVASMLELGHLRANVEAIGSARFSAAEIRLIRGMLAAR
jgi:aryl-alcohol dehydrogenase-like predicted oxidoreductase